MIATGWWLLGGREGDASLLARLMKLSDVELHEYLGWGLAAVGALGVVAGFGAAVTYVRDSFRFARGDGAWLAHWPAATFTGRFGRHDGHFDPGQRIANVVLAVGLGALVASGIGLVLVSGGPAFVWFLRVHKWATYVVTVFVGGHIVIASGLLPGYRGVWRAMHGRRGGVPLETAARLWPGWTERALNDRGTSPPSPRRD